jgi:hypothetical protein
MIFDGTAGSIKTTITSAIKSIIDPNGKSKEDNVSAIAEKPDDLIVQLYNRHLSSFDNVGHIDEKISDVLCRAITGSSNPKRKLYADGEEAIHNFKSKIVLNGVIPTLDYPDLQTRILNYERMSLDETNRITDKEFAEKFENLLPYVLGQIFVTLSKALKRYPNVAKTFKPRTRMADFEVWGETISQVLGFKKGEFLARYYEKLHEENISSQEAYPIISTLQEFMKNKQTHEDSAITSILNKIPGIQLNPNGTLSLNVTINTIVKLESELDQCELEEQSVDKCQLLSMIYTVLKNQYENQGTENIFRAISIALPVATALFGLYLGRILTDGDRKKQQQKELEKIRRLLNLDFSRIYHFKNSLRQNHENMRNDLQSEGFTPFCIDINTLTYLMKHLKAGIKFYHWKTLENSGSLIKLEPDEVQRFQFAYDQISGVDKNNEDAWLSLANKLEYSLINTSDLDDRSKYFEEEVKKYFNSIFLGYDTVDNAFKQLDIPWLNLTLFLKEYPNEEQKIDEFNSQQNNNVSESAGSKKS